MYTEEVRKNITVRIAQIFREYELSNKDVQLILDDIKRQVQHHIEIQKF